MKRDPAQENTGSWNRGGVGAPWVLLSITSWRLWAWCLLLALPVFKGKDGISVIILDKYFKLITKIIIATSQIK